MRKNLKWIIPAAVLLLLVAAFLVYSSNYYRMDDTAEAALKSERAVTVTQTGYGWLFDGPADDTALIFYPGAKVEATAYAPFLRLLAEGGMDVCLVEMPFHLAFFGMNQADRVMAEHDYVNWYIGGHSLGGAMAAMYAAKRGEQLAGLVLCAAYPTKTLPEHLRVMSVYGSEDGMITVEKLLESYTYVPRYYYEYKIEGGNHAKFGNYGPQKGDGIASVSAEEQQRLAADRILYWITSEPGGSV